MNSHLPIEQNLARAGVLSLVTALLMAVASLAGLLFQSAFYPTEALRHSFVSNDVVNLFIGLPILLGSLWLARRGQLLGLLFWPGALFYVTYNYIAYAFAVPLSAQSVLYLAMVALSVYVIWQLLSGIDSKAIQERLVGAVPTRFAGGVLVGLGALFFLRGIGQIVQAAVAGPELAVVVADLLTTPFWVIGGILLWRKQALGYVAGAGLLFQASMLFIGLLVFFILQPLLAAVPFPVEDFVVIFVMGLICFIPFGLFTRGIVKKS
jgi:hypothetical protein